MTATGATHGAGTDTLLRRIRMTRKLSSCRERMSVDMDLNIPAGQLTLAGGSSRLMDADFRYSRNAGKPKVDYSVTAGRGELRIGQDSNQWHTQFRNEDNEWNMRVANDVPLDLHLEMGAGQTDLRLNSVNVKNLDVHMGAGQLDLDLTGERKTSVDGTIEGGVGGGFCFCNPLVMVLLWCLGSVTYCWRRGPDNMRGDLHDAAIYIEFPGAVPVRRRT